MPPHAPQLLALLLLLCAAGGARAQGCLTRPSCGTGAFTCTGLNDGYCNCTSQWSGPNCNQCVNDSSCGLFEVCDRTFSAGLRKNFVCQPAALLTTYEVGPLTTECYFSASGSSVPNCTLQVWSLDGLAPVLFRCEMYGCSWRTGPGGRNDYRCESTACQCRSQWCIKYASIKTYMETRVHGASRLSCLEDGRCNLDQSDVPIPLSLTCAASECRLGSLASNSLAAWKVALLSTASGVVLLATVVVSVMCLVRRYRRKWLSTLDSLRERKHAIDEVTPVRLLWRDCAFELRPPCARCCCRRPSRRILRPCSGSAPPGALTAIMGPSGSGKTSLLDILGGFSTVTGASGQIFVDSHLVDFDRMPREVGYMTQDDALNTELTVQETLLFAAELRLPRLPWEEKRDRVEYVMRALDLMHVAHTKIGTVLNRGVSGGERKRVLLGIELLSLPPVLLLDEPTTGLDSAQAQKVVQLLQQLAARGHTVVVSIHQPRAEIFAVFKHFILVSSGHVVFQGERSKMIDFLNANAGSNAVASAHNPADGILDVLLDGGRPLAEKLEAAYLREASRGGTPEPDDLASCDSTVDVNTHVQLVRLASDGGIDGTSSSTSTSAASTYRARRRRRCSCCRGYTVRIFCSRFATLSLRSFVCAVRNPVQARLQYLLSIGLGIVLGVMFFAAPFDLRGAFTRLSVFFTVFLFILTLSLSAMFIISEDRATFMRERMAGSVGPVEYFLAKVFVEFSLIRIAPSLIMGLLTYFMAGMRLEPLLVVQFIFLVMLVASAGVSVVLTVAAAVHSLGIAYLVAILVMMAQLLFSGILANQSDSPISFLSYFSFLFYASEIAMVNELTGAYFVYSSGGLGDVALQGSAVLTMVGFSSHVPRDWALLCAFTFGWLVVGLLAVVFRARRSS